jgi:hypothetical protein
MKKKQINKNRRSWRRIGTVESEWEMEEYDGEDKIAKHKFSYNASCRGYNEEHFAQSCYKDGTAGVGVAFWRGIDGIYPVYAKFEDCEESESLSGKRRTVGRRR